MLKSFDLICAGEVPGKPTSFIRWHQGSHLPLKFSPLHDRLALRRLNAEEKFSGGIIIPGNAKEMPTEGEVVAGRASSSPSR